MTGRPALFAALDAAEQDPPTIWYGGGWGVGVTPQCGNCHETGLPSMGWHLDPDTGEYECAPR